MKSVESTTAGAVDQAIADGPREEILVYRGGRPVALITPFDDDDEYWYRVEHDPEFIASIARGRADFAAGRGISQEDLIKKLGLD